MSPKKGTRKTKAKKFSFARAALSVAGRTIERHPSIVGGSTAFAIIFIYIASNALYYQKSSHPAPILNMRGPQFIVSGSTRPVENAPIPIARGLVDENATTYRVTHSDKLPSDDIQTASIKLPIPAERPKNRAPIIKKAPETAEKTKPTTKPEKGSDLVEDIQGELTKLGLYKDKVDGLTGPNTSKAIEDFQVRNDLEVNGIASKKLLKQIRKSMQSSAPKTTIAETKPVEKPQDVASIITKTEPKAQKPAFSNDLVRKIQIGLSRSAYPDIVVDGLIGGETKEAIALFEKHYRLPVTGVPNQAVLDKLESIGAF